MVTSDPAAWHSIVGNATAGSVLPTLPEEIPALRRDGYLEGNGWQVTWAIGHLVQLKTPDEYDPALKRWSMDRLPFVPKRFELRPTHYAPGYLTVQSVARNAIEFYGNLDEEMQSRLLSGVEGRK